MNRYKNEELSSEQTLKHPSNNSVSKYQFSFPKDKRFRNRSRTQSIDNYYNLPTTNSKRTLDFKAYSKRYSHSHKDNYMPSPGSYNLISQFDTITKSKCNSKFLKGRNECKAFNMNRINDGPGPGAYNPNPQVFSKKISLNFTMRRKLPKQANITNDSPGPGAYPINSSLLQSSKVLSKDIRMGVYRMVPVSQKSLKNLQFPQIYYPKMTIHGDNIEKVNVYKWSKSQRFPRHRQKTQPGPGQYRLFSQFSRKYK